jgi:hypothetical protein
MKSKSHFLSYIIKQRQQLKEELIALVNGNSKKTKPTPKRIRIHSREPQASRA